MFPMDIEKLIEQGRRGDETALRGLYRTYYQRMARICQRIVGDRRVAEELSHDAFLLAFAKMDSLRNPRRFESWLTSITTNVALRYKQRHQEPAMLSLSTLTEEELAQETMPEDDKPLPTMAELMEAVNALPKGYGQVFRLAVIEEMSHKEIAEIMGIATHSSSSQLARAKKVLQTHTSLTHVHRELRTSFFLNLLYNLPAHPLAHQSSLQAEVQSQASSLVDVFHPYSVPTKFLYHLCVVFAPKFLMRFYSLFITGSTLYPSRRSMAIKPSSFSK